MAVMAVRAVMVGKAKRAVLLGQTSDRTQQLNSDSGPI